MKINIREGIYRIFVLASFICVFYVFLCGEFDYFWQYALAAFCAGIFIYMLYFLLEWIVEGFTQTDNYGIGLRNFIKTIFNKLKSLNYRVPFLICLVVLFLSIILGYTETKMILKLKRQINSCEKSNDFLNKMYSECSSELDLCKDKLKGVLNDKNEKDLTEDIDVYTAKDYHPY